MLKRGEAGRTADVTGIRRSIRFALGRDVHNHHVTEVRVRDLADLKRVLKVNPSGADGGPYICASAMRDGVRNSTNALPMTVLIVDFDKLTRGLWSAVAAALPQWGIACVYWRTRRSTPGSPRRKLIVLLDQQIKATDYSRVHAAFVAKLSRRVGVDLVVDPSSDNPAQPQFTPMATVAIHIVRGRPFPVPALPDEPLGASPKRWRTAKQSSLVATPPRGFVPLRGLSRVIWRHQRTRVAAALAYLDPSDYDTWIRAGMAIHLASGGEEDGFALWRRWSAGQLTGQEPDNYKGPDDCRARWNGFRHERERLITLGTVFSLAKDAGFICR